MSREQRKDSGKQCEMLPWYVNGQLTEAEAVAVESHLGHCTSCARELPVLRAVQESMQRDSVAVLTPTPDTDGFLARLDSAAAKNQPRTSPAYLGALAAAAALLGIALYWWGSAQVADIPTKFETVTGSANATTFDYVLHISLDRNLDARQQQAILQSMGAVSVAGPDSEQQYRVVLRLPAHSMAELENYRRDIESTPSILSASFVAVELPVE